MILLVLWGCTGAHTDTSHTDVDTDADTDPTDTGEWQPECPAGSSDIPGVCVVFFYETVTFTLAEAAAGVSIPWAVVVHETTVSVVTPIPQDAGGCATPGPSGLATFAQLGGGGQGWCLCDVGLCPDNRVPTPLVEGVHRDTFTWDGRNWTGPSDFGNPPGDPFPPGTYTLDVSARGTRDSAPVVVQNAMTVVLTP